LRESVTRGGEPTLATFAPADGYEEGYTFARTLLDRGAEFTALFSWDDVAAIGVIRALLDAGLRVPGDVSVVGFDDIQSAAYHNPTLTTLRQPLRRMGELSVEILLREVSGDEAAGTSEDFVTVAPELI